MNFVFEETTLQSLKLQQTQFFILYLNQSEMQKCKKKKKKITDVVVCRNLLSIFCY